MTKRFFFDCEFIEGFKKPISWLPSSIGNFNKPYHSIQLITIGIVADDGREYYAVSNEFNPDDANEWVRENIFVRLLTDYVESLQGVRKQLAINCLDGKNCAAGIRILQKWVGKSNKEIACDILQFVYDKDCARIKSYNGDLDAFYKGMLSFEPKSCGEATPEFYAYFADYDHICLSSLYGTMSNLPTGFPMYTKDIQQIIDDNKIDKDLLLKEVSQTNCHNALQDAIWNRSAYEWICNKIKK